MMRTFIFIATVCILLIVSVAVVASIDIVTKAARFKLILNQIEGVLDLSRYMVYAALFVWGYLLTHPSVGRGRLGHFVSRRGSVYLGLIVLLCFYEALVRSLQI